MVPAERETAAPVDIVMSVPAARMPAVRFKVLRVTAALRVKVCAAVILEVSLLNPAPVISAPVVMEFPVQVTL